MLDGANRLFNQHPAVDGGGHRGAQEIFFNGQKVLAVSVDLVSTVKSIQIPAMVPNFASIWKILSKDREFTLFVNFVESARELKCSVQKVQLFCNAGDRVDITIDFEIISSEDKEGQSVERGSSPQRVLTWADCIVECRGKSDYMICNFTVSFGENWQTVHIETIPTAAAGTESPKKLVPIKSIKIGKVKIV